MNYTKLDCSLEGIWDPSSKLDSNMPLPGGHGASRRWVLSFAITGSGHHRNKLCQLLPCSQWFIRQEQSPMKMELFPVPKWASGASNVIINLCISHLASGVWGVCVGGLTRADPEESVAEQRSHAWHSESSRFNPQHLQLTGSQVAGDVTDP